MGGTGGEGSYPGRGVGVTLPWGGGATGLCGGSTLIAVVQAAHFGELDDVAHVGPVHRSRNGAVLVQRQMRS